MPLVIHEMSPLCGKCSTKARPVACSVSSPCMITLAGTAALCLPSIQQVAVLGTEGVALASGLIFLGELHDLFVGLGRSFSSMLRRCCFLFAFSRTQGLPVCLCVETVSVDQPQSVVYRISKRPLRSSPSSQTSDLERRAGSRMLVKAHHSSVANRRKRLEEQRRLESAAEATERLHIS